MAVNNQQARKVNSIAAQILKAAGGDPSKVTDGHIRKIVGHAEKNATIPVSVAQVKAALAARKAVSAVRKPRLTPTQQAGLRVAAEEAFMISKNMAPKGAQMAALAKKHGFSPSQVMSAIQKLATEKGMKLVTSKSRTIPSSIKPKKHERKDLIEARFRNIRPARRL